MVTVSISASTNCVATFSGFAVVDFLRNIAVNFGDVRIPSFWLSAFSPACVSAFMELLSFRDHDVSSLKMTTSGHMGQKAGLLKMIKAH